MGNRKTFIAEDLELLLTMVFHTYRVDFTQDQDDQFMLQSRWPELEPYYYNKLMELVNEYHSKTGADPHAMKVPV